MKDLLKRATGVFRRTFTTSAPQSPLLVHIDPAILLPTARSLRLGTAYGGWLIPQDHGLNADSICYLAGAGEDISFDCALVKRFQATVRIIDPTPRAIEHFRMLEESVLAGRPFPVNNSDTEFYDIGPEDLPRLKFLPVGLADVNKEFKFFFPEDPAHVSCSTANLQGTSEFFVAQCHRLASLMAQLGDTRIDLLKMDIEGAEYSVIGDLVANGLLPKLLLIEFDEAHSLSDDRAVERIGRHIQLLLDAGMRPLAVEGSNITLIKTKPD
jgi:FkbM family methyltransferase